MEFHCIQDCSQCCIEREYYPGKKFGKIGVLILPEEKEKIEIRTVVPSDEFTGFLRDMI